MAARVAEPHDAVAGDRTVAAQLELALDGAHRLHVRHIVRPGGSGIDLAGVGGEAGDAQRLVLRLANAARGGGATDLDAPLRRGPGRRPLRQSFAGGRGCGSRLQKQRVDRHPCRHQQETQQRNPSLPWGHYPYSCAYPVPGGIIRRGS